MLWNSSQESWRQFAIRCFKQSIGDQDLNHEAAVDNFVQIHNGQGAQAKTGLHFNPASVTEANRLKANNATFWRYVERDEFFEMLPYVLASMTEEAKLAFASQYLAPAGLAVRLMDKDETDEFNFEHVAETQDAGCEALTKATKAAIHSTPENLAAAEMAVDRAIEKFKRTRAIIAAVRNAGKKTGAAIGKLIHRKDKVTQ